ncbi:elongation factor P maturation arginine rhamnosyltransferase EarP [Rhodoferax sp.]|uniref:elongation factor P maturation arginine rhamnosyltransferase EarP n=1 Tax=Rhodoferax sp. TaxID=50421 RepID=UPI0027715368|nr:elongation factor P maturation arginine rhamnosyltransferase EarP [Rhodoferax sp.]
MTAAAPPALPALLWDIFCKVIDNYGDLGVCWRLSRELAARGQRVRLWVDDARALRWMAPLGCPGVEVRAWTQPLALQGVAAGEVLVEAFGCELAPELIAIYADKQRAGVINIAWINLEYLSAEHYVERSHGLSSPVMSGPGAGLTKRFFYPGFTPRTGGLLREPDLLQRQADFDRTAWLRQQGIEWRPGEQLVSLFCYEPGALPQLLDQLASQAVPSRLLVTQGRASAALQSAIENKNRLQPLWNARGMLSISYRPLLDQIDFDHLLWSCDVNFVRGEDSLVRALWAGQPLVWQIYPQHDDAHLSKLEAFLDTIQAPASLRRFHRTWNGVNQGPLEPLALPAWGEAIQAARAQLLQQPDLVSQLLEFVDSVGA